MAKVSLEKKDFRGDLDDDSLVDFDCFLEVAMDSLGEVVDCLEVVGCSEVCCNSARASEISVEIGWFLRTLRGFSSRKSLTFSEDLRIFVNFL